MKNFTLEELLGASNYEVWAATHKLTQRKVALKLIPYKADEDVPKISEEVQKQVKLRHPHIIEVYGADTDTDKKLVLIEMERADAGSLASRLGDGKRLPIEEALRIITDVLEGLEYAHGQKIIHFDIKPDNILLFKNGTAKLADFGLSKVLGSRSFTSRVGGYTPYYEGPEYHNGTELFGPRTDLWAVGVVLYIALTGRKPFLSSEQILKCKFEPLTAILPRDPQIVALQRVLERVFVLYPKRLVSAKEFRDALEPLIQPAAPPAPKPAPVFPRRALIGTGVVGLLGVGVGIGKLLGGIGTPPTPTPTPKPRLGLTVAEACALPPTYPAPKTLAEYKAQMVSIPGGTFEMGSNSGESDEKPIHTVTLSAFSMGRTPVTVAMWREFCTATKCVMPSTTPYRDWEDDHPIVNVSWTDCKAYADWASAQLGIAIELPTEAQWEYASRGGLAGTDYPWVGSMDDSKLWCSVATHATSKKFLYGTAPVSRSNNVFVNGYGLLDMSGNVWQWCRDRYGAYGSGRVTDPTGVSKGTDHVIRGGSWYIEDAYFFRCADRLGSAPDGRGDGIGVRLASPLPAL